jgi:D-alanyl-D-alanine-carboxypeptidase/D-alanyl-D-alanine-endopeptidase
MHRLLAPALVLLSLPLLAQSPAADSPPQPVAAVTAPQTALLPLTTADSLGAELFAKSGSTGMVMVIVRGHDVLFRGYGETFPGSGQKPDARSILRLCSLSKIFATDLLVKLVKDGTVTLQDPLQKFAPPHVRVAEYDGTPITLESLATHTAGLPRTWRVHR